MRCSTFCFKAFYLQRHLVKYVVTRVATHVFFELNKSYVNSSLNRRNFYHFDCNLNLYLDDVLKYYIVVTVLNVLQSLYVTKFHFCFSEHLCFCLNCVTMIQILRYCNRFIFCEYFTVFLCWSGRISLILYDPTKVWILIEFEFLHIAPIICQMASTRHSYNIY